jgi:general secretion pathway protein E
MQSLVPNPRSNLTLDRMLTLRDVLTPLVIGGLLAAEEAERRLRQWQRASEHPLILCGELGLRDRKNPARPMSYDEIAAVVGEGLKVPYTRIDTMKVNLEVMGQILPYAYVERLGIVPVEMDDTRVIIVTAEPFLREWHDEVAAQTRRRVEIRLGSPVQIRHLLNEIFVVQKAFRAVAREQGRSGGERLRLLREGKTVELDALLEKSRGKTFNAQDGHVAKIVDWLLNFAVLERASDIHLEPKKGLGQVRFRVDGELRPVYRMDPEALQMIIARFKILGEMKLDEKRKPQDGGIKRNLENGKPVEMRLSTLPTANGEKLVIRIFDKNVVGQDLSFIGFSATDLAEWEWMINQPQGLVLVTGPTGSGKTTTLYTSLNRVATPDVNVCTAEDPIEMEVDSFSQVQVNPGIGLTFAECIRSFLRQDPDIIMVGEIRDLETGEMAIQSSLTGHLVFSTLHTNGALATIQRLVDLGLPTFLLNSSLLGILAQRLVRKLCGHCKEAVPTDAHRWATLLDGDELPMPPVVYEARGCEECKQTGYLGRVCIYELVKFDDVIKKVIHQKVDLVELRERTRGRFVSLRVNGARKIAEGETTLEEVLKVAY